MKTNLQNELGVLDRLTGPTPKLFSNIRIVGIVLSAVSAFLLTLESQGITLTPWLGVLNSVIVQVAGLIAGLTGISVASLTVDLEAFKKLNALKR